MARCADQLRAWRAVLHYEPCCPRATKRTLAASAVTTAATALLLLAALLVWRRPAAEPGAECRTRDTGQVASAGYTSLYSVLYTIHVSAALRVPLLVQGAGVRLLHHGGQRRRGLVQHRHGPQGALRGRALGRLRAGLSPG